MRTEIGDREAVLLFAALGGGDPTERQVLYSLPDAVLLDEAWARMVAMQAVQGASESSQAVRTN